MSNSRSAGADVRRRTRAARAVVPFAVVFAVIAPAAMLTLWLTAGQPDFAAALTGFAVVLALGRILLSGALALHRRGLAGRPALDDLLPADLWAGLLVLPIATVTVSALSSAALTVGSLTIGDDPVLGAAWRVYALLFLIFAALIAVLVPTAAAYRTVRQRAEDEVRVFDDTVPDDDHARALEGQWSQLCDRPRWWLPARRLRALGTLSTEPPRAWPTRWRRAGGSIWLTPTTVMSGLVTAALVGAATAMLEALPEWPRLVGGLMFLLALPALAVLVEVYRRLLIEQSRSQVLRAALSQRERLIATRRLAQAGPDASDRGDRVTLLCVKRRDLLRALFTRNLRL